MKYQFKARDKQGDIVTGMVEAIDSHQAIQLLQERDLIPITLEREDRQPEILKELNRIWEGVKPRELMVFFRELATLIAAKVPILSSLRAIESQTVNRYFRRVIREMADNIEDGMPLSEALSKHPLIFSPLTISMIQSGEASGNLQKSIEYVADNIEKSYKLASKVKGALIYPAIVVIATIIISFLIFAFILPKITQVIRDLSADIPWYTQLLMAFGDFMKAYWWAVLLVMLAGVGAFFYYINTEAGKREWDVIKLRLPVFGDLFRKVYLARFADNLSTLLAGGIPLVRALTITSNVVGNLEYKKVILRAAEEVKKGGNISTVFRRTPLVPPIVTQMTEIGENTGQVSEILKDVSKFYEQEVDNTTRNLTTLIEPIMIIILGVIVGVMVVAVLLPIYNIAGQIQ